MNENSVKTKKIKLLNQTVKRQKKKIISLKTTIESLTEKNMINDDEAVILLDNFGKHKDLITRFTKKNSGEKLTRKYSMELRRFAISLHFFSPRAYKFIRHEFNSVLPDPRTLSKWYAHVDAQPGISSEALYALKLKCSNSSKPIYCALVMDEMAIRKHLEWDGQQYHGYIDIGTGINNESVELASECLVFVVVAINESWKIPIAYFLTNHLSSSQKSELMERCLDQLLTTGVNIVSLTFDGCATNINVAKRLGCNFDINNLKSDFSLHDYPPINIIPDPSHMIKLVRNTFGEKGNIIDDEGKVISFIYLKKLLELQENEKCHLANRLKKNHIFYFKKKMKVNLATQLLSKSVADALKFCKYNLKLKEFNDCDATIRFIIMFNDAFDILNSRKINDFDKKKALCMLNFDSTLSFIHEFFSYVKALRFSDGELVINSQRKTGFIGFLMCFNSLINLKKNLIDSNALLFLPFYKLSQDHIELLFGSIRAHGGHNNNPTARQFKSAFKKLLIHAEVRDGGLGNCIPLEQIGILYWSSTKDPVDIINNTNINFYKENIQFEQEDYHLKDHDYLVTSNLGLSMFAKEVVIYLAGFVVHKLEKKLFCEVCESALVGNKQDLLNSLINIKTKGGLSYPSEDVISICMITEKYIKEYYNEKKPVNKLLVETKVLSYFTTNCPFKNISYHQHDSDPLTNHIILLIKSIISIYFDTKIHYLCKSSSETISLRHWYNKLIIFKGQ